MSIKRRIFEKVKKILMKFPILLSIGSSILVFFPGLKLRIKEKWNAKVHANEAEINSLNNPPPPRLQALEKRILLTIREIKKHN